MVRKKEPYLKQFQTLTLPVSRIKGIGPKRALLLQDRDIYTLLDLLFFLPIRYEDRTSICPIRDAEPGKTLLVKGTIVSSREQWTPFSGKRLFKIVIHDGSGSLELVWFNYRKPHLSSLGSSREDILAFGKITAGRRCWQMVHPDITVLNTKSRSSDQDILCFRPVYPSIRGIAPKLLRSFIRTAFKYQKDSLLDPVPERIIRDIHLPPLRTALEKIHFPPADSSIDDLNTFSTSYHKRLIFDRFFLVMLLIAYRKKMREKTPSHPLSIPSDLALKLRKIFPFDLTADQINAIEDIVNDFTSPKPMNRLLMGDVGCGKTAVAAVAAYISVLNNEQVALMAPTQILASQHFDYFSSVSQGMGFRPVLLTGSLKKSEKLQIYEKIRSGYYNLVIGTQSLIQEELVFSSLGLVIIDEQHRFGVKDRALIDRKGKNPNLLVLTATPIPRTLAVTTYGDMDISMIRTFPEGHLPVSTHLVREDQKRELFNELTRTLSRGQQAFVICPAIEGSEDAGIKDVLNMAKSLKKLLCPRFKVGLVHGRLPGEQRETAMDNFRKGRTDVLVSTTVIEVGVHVPKATIMIIEHPERFGLAQLHQLRGRVGRSGEKGACFLVISKNISPKALSRLEVFAETLDGFEIAQKDLEQRGHGEVAGMKQTGIGDLDPAEIIRENELFLMAKEQAERIITADPDLTSPENSLLRSIVDSLLSRPIDL